MPSFAVVAGCGMDYPGGMATVGDVPRPRKRASQDETTPFLLEFEVVQNEGRRIQDETAPFPLMLEALRRRKQRRGQDETSPFLLALAGEPEPDEATPRTRRGRRSLPSLTLPSLTVRGLSASSELREYAARVASGEDLPPYSGPILASDGPSNAALDERASVAGDSPRPSERVPEPAAERAPPSARRAHAGIESGATDSTFSDSTFAEDTSTQDTARVRPSSPTSSAKVVLGLLLLLGALVASATAGDDATLRAAGDSVSRWFSGGTPSYAPPAPAAPAAAPAATPCAATATTPPR